MSSSSSSIRGTEVEGIEQTPATIVRPGLTHVGLICDDIERTRAELEGRGVVFLTTGIADVAGLRTAWFRDPWGTVFILLQKDHEDRPYWRQFDR